MAWQPVYASVAELKAYERIADLVDDNEIAFALEASSRSVDQYANRQFGKTALEARVYTPEWDRRRCRWVVEIDDVQDITGLLVSVDDDDDGVFDKPVDDFRLFPFNAADTARPYEMLVVRPTSTNLPVTTEGSLQVTALFGWNAVPVPVKQACLLQANRLMKRRDAPFGVAGSPEIGSELRLLDKVDPDVAVALRPFQRWWSAA